MTEAVLIRPGHMSLADLRLIYRGAPAALDPIARADVEAAVAGLLSAGSAPAGSDGSAAQAEPFPGPAGSGEQIQAGVARLVVALKLASLGQGYSGARWGLLIHLADTLNAPAGPTLRDDGGGDRAVMAGLLDLLRPDSDQAGRPGFPCDEAEHRALLSGTQVSAAFALAGLFEAERIFQSALIASALSIAALGHANGFHHPRVHKLNGYRGQVVVAAAIRALLPDAGALASPPAAILGEPSSAIGPTLARMGACLDLLQQAGATLQLAANAVTEDQLIFWQADQIVPGLEDASSVAFAADLIALALREIGALAPARIAGLGSRSPQGAAAVAPWRQMLESFAAENTEQACAVSAPHADLDSRGPCAPGTRRLLPMAGTTALIIAIELLVTARAVAFDSPEGSNSPIRDLVRPFAAAAGDAGMPAADLSAAAELVRSGALAAAAAVPLPSVVENPPCPGFPR